MAEKKATEPAARTVVIPALERSMAQIRIRGVTPLIAHQFGETQKQAIEGKQQQKPQLAPGPRNPEQEYIEAMYKTDDGRHAFPARGLKRAMVNAGFRFTDEKGVNLMGMFTIPAELLMIEGPGPRMGRDVVRLSGISRPADLRYRPYYWPWEMVVPIRLIENFISIDQILSLLILAGETVGIGDWRPEKKGSAGQFEYVAVESYKPLPQVKFEKKGVNSDKDNRRK